MRRFIVAILCLILAAPIIAQVPTTANLTAQLAEQTAKRDEAERKLMIREAADELEDAQTEQAYNRFEIVMGAFSVLITILVIAFGFRTEKAAARAAQNEVAGAKAEIETLVKEALAAAEAAKVAQTALATIKAKVDTLLANTQSAAAEAEENASRSRKAAEIIENVSKAASAERATTRLSAEEERIVEAAAEESADKPEQSLTVDEYKARIGKARYIDANWDEVLRLAEAMAMHHAGDDEALAFALNKLGDAYLELNRHDYAIAAYGKVIQRFEETKDMNLQQHLIWAMHHKGLSLIELGRVAEAEAALRELLLLCERVDDIEHSNVPVTRYVLARAILNQGRAAEAEAALRELLPLCERVNGAEHSNTLVTRHELARAILDQGRAAEAEAALHELLPLRERVDGFEHINTLITRRELARAVFENGDATEASAILAVIPDKPNQTQWPQRHLAQLAFIHAKVADALGKRDDANDWLAKAKTHYAAAYPPDSHYRQQFDAYVAARPR